MKQTEGVDWLAQVPKRICDHELADGERVQVIVPRFRWRIFRSVQRLLRRPDIRVRLDPVGSLVWLCCDGEHTVQEIADLLQARFGEQVDPVLPRLHLYFVQMVRGRLVAFG